MGPLHSVACSPEFTPVFARSFTHVWWAESCTRCHGCPQKKGIRPFLPSQLRVCQLTRFCCKRRPERNGSGHSVAVRIVSLCTNLAVYRDPMMHKVNAQRKTLQGACSVGVFLITGWSDELGQVAVFKQNKGQQDGGSGIGRAVHQTQSQVGRWHGSPSGQGRVNVE